MTILEGLLPTHFTIFGLEIHFYAICILAGALLALFLAAYEGHKEGYSWDLFYSIFLIAFPLGIVGARIWYVIAEWNKEFGFENFARVFAIWDGGLAIQGGVILGVIAGVLVVRYRRRGMPVMQAIDFAVPGILVAQAIGRWGNFFNQEVYGALVLRDTWDFLPSFILNQMHLGGTPDSQIAVPLFLVESIINLGGYFLIAHFIKPLMGRRYRYGDCCCLYFAFYGLVRAILEPMRNPTFIMGEKVQASFVMAIVFVGAGIIGLLVNHLIPVWRKSQAGRIR